MRISEHFSVSEFDCHDGTPYPSEWVDSRLKLLADTLEIILAAAGGANLNIMSAYRTPTYNRSIGSMDGSQHIQGRAADIKHPTMSPDSLHKLILSLYQAGKLPSLGGLGKYNTFLHVDVRPNGGHLAQWNGKGLQEAASSGDPGKLALSLDLSFASGASADDAVDFDNDSSSGLLGAFLMAVAIGAAAFLLL